jgi:hypothetical protein
MRPNFLATLAIPLLLSLVATACARAAPTGAPPARIDAAPNTAGVDPAGSSASAQTVAWTRPLDVAPLPAEGKFEVISEAPWPGQKVRVFFFGVQG